MLTVEGVYKKQKGGNLYFLRCSSCSVDTELYPPKSILSKKGNLDSGKLPCGCGVKSNYNKDQYEILAKRVAISYGFIFISFKEEFTSRAKAFCIVQNPKSGDSWEVSLIRLLSKGTKDPEDVRLSKVTPKYEVESEIIKILSQCGGTFVGWNEGYFNQYSIFTWRCKEGHMCTKSRVIDFIKQGKRCGKCCLRGFNRSKPATLYLVRWYGFGEDFLKIGITNQSNFLKRVKGQFSVSKLDYEVLHIWKYPEGFLAEDLESEIKQNMSVGVCPKSWLPDGYTETLYNTKDNVSQIKQIIEGKIKDG